MTFENKQELIFFQVVEEKAKDRNKVYVDTQVIESMVGKIDETKAKLILNDFNSKQYIYQDHGKISALPHYEISASGYIYYNFLKEESEKMELDRKSIKATIKTGKLTRKNIKIGWILGIVTLLDILTNLGITAYREWRLARKEQSDSLQQSKTLKLYQEVNQKLYQISQSLSDTSKVKVRIEK